MQLWTLTSCGLALACAPPPDKEVHAADSGPACHAAPDSDGDGLDDCTEAALGTDPHAADTDGDGLTDGEEVDCTSSPTDPTQACYACGWPHNNPGSFSDVGPTVGSTLDNLELIDQCGERVQLWDLSGAWHILFMTASWCTSCLEEARHFDALQAAVVTRTGQDFSFVTVVFQDSAGTLPAADEGARYADTAQIHDQPVFADPIAAVLEATPYDGSLLPGVCALSPEMVLVDCRAGEGAVDGLLEVVEAALR